jgi:hypothetical protein
MDVIVFPAARAVEPGPSKTLASMMNTSITPILLYTNCLSLQAADFIHSPPSNHFSNPLSIRKKITDRITLFYRKEECAERYIYNLF